MDDMKGKISNDINGYYLPDGYKEVGPFVKFRNR